MGINILFLQIKESKMMFKIVRKSFRRKNLMVTSVRAFSGF